MGLPARNDYSDAVSGQQVVPIHPPEVSATPPVPLLLEAIGSDSEYGALVGKKLGAAVEAISRAYSRAWIRLSDGYAEASFHARELMSRTRNRAVRRIDERPLQVLGIIAGISFAAGVALRIWRSRKS